MTDVEQVIETLKRISDLDTSLHLNIRQYDLFTAIEALREETEREKGCEFCNAEYAVMSGSRMTYDGIHKGCTARYCPMCGKRLVRK